jgi:hypothetical protein
MADQPKQPWRGRRGRTRPAAQRLAELFDLELLRWLKSVAANEAILDSAVLEVIRKRVLDLMKSGVLKAAPAPSATSASDIIQAAARRHKDEVSRLRLALDPSPPSPPPGFDDEAPRTAGGHR